MRTPSPPARTRGAVEGGVCVFSRRVVVKKISRQPPAGVTADSSGIGYRRPTTDDRLRVRQVVVHELGHLEHVDLALAAEDGLQVRVRVDVALVRLILQVVLLD